MLVFLFMSIIPYIFGEPLQAQTLDRLCGRNSQASLQYCCGKTDKMTQICSA